MNLQQTLKYDPVELGFGTSGLRGLVTDITDLECYINTAGFLLFLHENDGLQHGEIVYLAGDLRQSTLRIMRVVTQAISDGGYKPVNCGFIPTPAVAYYGLKQHMPAIMVTGSHIPNDRNGIKFYKRDGEVLKSDEAAIKAAVAKTREELYAQAAQTSDFSNDGSYKKLMKLSPIEDKARQVYLDRYTQAFPADSLAGKKIVVYQHSAVGRDLLVEVLESLGAIVRPALRSEVFVPIDSENVTAADKQLFQQLARLEPNVFAVVSTDGDSDRPFVIDEEGVFYRGDLLGCIAADYLGAEFVAVPISSNDAVDMFSEKKGVTVVHTKIGSPYVVVAMQQASSTKPIVGWEVNGGLLLGSTVTINGKQLDALPTRDAILPILLALLTASSKHQSISAIFADLPKRYTGGGLIDDIDLQLIVGFNEVCKDDGRVRKLMADTHGLSELGTVEKLDTTDGLRLLFSNGEIIHLRPSGNAPQFRVYTNADTQARADQLADAAIASDGYIIQILDQLT